MQNTNIYWKLNKVLTYNAMINIIIGERGVGKSYSTKKYAIKHAIKTGKKFIYLRRYDTELELMLKQNDFFKDVQNDEELINHEFNVNGKVAYCDNEVIGYFVPLSKQSHYKSIPFPDVDIIIFDEVFIQSNRYLKNEITQFLELLETVGRLRNIKVFLLSNWVSVVNPYFMYFDLSLPYGKEYKLFKNGSILVVYIKNELYRAVKNQSTFGKLIQGTPYGEYAIENKALNDTKSFIKKKSRGSYHFFNIVINGNTFGVWKDIKENCIVISKDIKKECPVLLSFDFNSHTEKTTFVRTRSPYFKSLINSYSRGMLFFESAFIKENMINLISKYLF